MNGGNKRIGDILAAAYEIADHPIAERPITPFPAILCGSLNELDPKRVSLVIHDDYPVFVYPKGMRPNG